MARKLGLASFLLLVGCASNSVLESPRALSVPGDLSTEMVGDIVRPAIENDRDWTIIEKPASDRLIASLAYKSLSKKVAVSWDEKTVTFKPLPDDGTPADATAGTYSFGAHRYRILTDALLKNIRNKLARESSRLAELHMEPRRTIVKLDKIVLGDRIDAAKAKLAAYGAPSEEASVKTADGIETGYFLVTYDGHPPSVGSNYVTLVFFNGSYLAHALQDKGDTELLVFDDYTSKLWEAKKISFREYVEWKKLKWFQVRNVTPDAYDEELFLYQIWQAERVDQAKSTLTEYRFLIKERDRQIAQAKTTQALAEQQSASAQRATAYQAEMLALQRQSVEQQRRTNVSRALLNAFSAAYQPSLPRSINCTSYTSFSGYSTTTTCY